MGGEENHGFHLPEHENLNPDPPDSQVLILDVLQGSPATPVVILNK